MKLHLTTLCLSFFVIFSASAETDGSNLPVPIDGGISILLASGVAYGIKKINDSKKSNK